MSEQGGDTESFTNLFNEQELGKIEEPNFIRMAVFSGAKFVGQLDKEHILAYSILKGTLSEIYYTIPDIMHADKIVAVLIRQNIKPKIKVKIEDNVPNIDIKLYLNAKLAASVTTVDYLDPDNKKKLSEAINNKLTELLNSHLEKITRDFKADIVGFGRYAKINYLTFDDFYNVKWLSIYPNSKFNLELIIDLNTSQIISNALQPESYNNNNDD